MWGAAVAAAAVVCNQTNKQKALYAEYTYTTPLSKEPALEVAAAAEWTHISKMRQYGKNGIFAAQPFGVENGPGGYFGSQVTGGSTNGTVLWSVWDKALKTPRQCPHAPNQTWCQHLHAFPVSGACRRHCNDCGAAGHGQTTGSQCPMHLPIAEGDTVEMRLYQAKPNASVVVEGITYHGGLWTAEASVSGRAFFEVGTMLLEDTYGGVSRLGSFHEHIGCTVCDAFSESETRHGPWIGKSRTPPVSASFTPISDKDACRLFNASIDDKAHTVTFTTGPGTGPGI
eukprot:Hpha_TRINITY_DN8058_c0_g1::TRINITY_DN8058_c0_g1_i1::g.140193::m.140193